MKRIFMIAVAAAFVASCGPSHQVIDYENEEVNVGFGATKRKQMTTAVGKLEVDREEVATYANIYDYLRGRVPGLEIGPGDNPDIRIRGISSIQGDMTPLFMVDGARVSSIGYIAPSEVDRVEVIKDGSAAIYGPSGANGVIIITTRSK